MDSMRGFVACAIISFGCGHVETPSVTIASRPVVAQAAPAVVQDDDIQLDFPCAPFAPDGITPDATKARACLERVVKTQDACDKQSPTLERLELAVSFADGAGGLADPAHAKSLLATCFEDISVQEVVEHVEKHGAPYATCDTYALTTFATAACLGEHEDNERLFVQRMKRQVRTQGILRAQLFETATKAFEVYAKKIGGIRYMQYAGGTMRDPAMRNALVNLARQRRARLDKLFDHGELPTAPPLATAERNATRALDGARENAEGNTDVLGAIEEARAAWPAYRDAEIAFYENVKQGSRDAVRAALDVEFFGDFCPNP